MKAKAKITATWLWDAQQIASQPDQILQFAAKHKVNLIYLQIDRALPESAYQAFIGAAARKGVAVHALDGHPEWVLPEERNHIADLVEWVKSYNSKVRDAEKFQGVHIDVEPYLLADWNTDQDRIVGLWMDAISAFRQAMDTTPRLTAGADLPFWLDDIEVTSAGEGKTRLSDWVIKRLDQATLMSYRNRATGDGGIASLVTSKLVAADRLGKQIIVGVETNPSTEGDFVTFYRSGEQGMETQLAALVRALKGYRSFAGYAVHDYTGWSHMRP